MTMNPEAGQKPADNPQHVFFLIGFRNRVAVLFNWWWAYWSYQRAARIILGRSDQDE